MLVLTEMDRSWSVCCSKQMHGFRPEELKFLYSYLLIWGSSALPEIGAMSTGIAVTVDSQYE